MALFVLCDVMNDFDRMRPSRLLNQHFGLGLCSSDLLNLLLAVERHQLPMMSSYYRPWRVDTEDTGSMVQCNEDRFQVNLDVQQFSPDEIQVKVVGDFVVVEAKHEEKQDEHGYISRQLVRKYNVPKEYKLEAVASNLSSDGVLTISASRCKAIQSEERVVPITRSDAHKTVQQSAKKDSQ